VNVNDDWVWDYGKEQWKTLPGVTCLCPTYGRPPDRLHVLEEAIESFLRQDYPGPRQLLILNDAVRQWLDFEGGKVPPGTYLVNADHRFPSVGAKMNWLCENAKYDLLLPWDDDDISLPDRISQAVFRLGNGPYWNPGFHWHLDFDDLQYLPEQSVCGHAASIFRKDAWKKAGKYPADSSNGYDQELNGRLWALERLPSLRKEHPEEWKYVCCWAGRSPTHISGYGLKADAAYHNEVAERGRVKGVWRLRPHWGRDYPAMVARKLEELGRA
jgi:hypothetical protein